ncbi:hypothetical protein R8510_04931 [Ralstonia chuxiongensis]|nr:hypothetical protein R8510_04931 [Ralstonia chuxiongensis]
MTVESQADFAKRHGVSRKTVTVWKERGWLVMQGSAVDVEKSNDLLKRYRDPNDPRAKRGVTQDDLGNKQGNNLGNKVTTWVTTRRKAATKKKAKSPSRRPNQNPKVERVHTR